jgi:hypothetical protein
MPIYSSPQSPPTATANAPGAMSAAQVIQVASLSSGWMARQALLCAQYAAGVSTPRYLSPQDLISYGTGCSEADDLGGGALANTGGYAYVKKTQYALPSASARPWAIFARVKFPAPVTGQLSMFGWCKAPSINKNVMIGSYYDGSVDARTKLLVITTDAVGTTVMAGPVIDPAAYMEVFLGWDLVTLSLVANGVLVDSKAAAAVYLPTETCAINVRTNTSTFVIGDLGYAV